MGVSLSKAEWNELIEEHYKKIYSFAYQLTGSPTEAADVTQETFLRAWRSLGELRSKDAFRAWLYKIARNFAYDKGRWWKRWGFSSSLMPEKGSISMDETMERREIKRALEKLPGRQREVFVLRHYHGFSTEETAELLGIDGGSVKSHLSRAIGKLRSALEERDEK